MAGVFFAVCVSVVVRRHTDTGSCIHVCSASLFRCMLWHGIYLSCALHARLCVCVVIRHHHRQSTLSLSLSLSLILTPTLITGSRLVKTLSLI